MCPSVLEHLREKNEIVEFIVRKKLILLWESS
jgi:hypothetical protein